MKPKSTRGFTLIELMVALVVAGLLMGVLVGLSGAVQKSLGFSKEITELQANLRFGMKTLVDDLSRAGFMSSADPTTDRRREPLKALEKCPPKPLGLEAMLYDNSTGTITLRGNYTSSRDYLYEVAKNLVVCRNKMLYNKLGDAGTRCGENAYEPNDEPFADGPGRIEDVFCPGQPLRMDVDRDGRYCYYIVANVDPTGSGLQFQQPVNQNAIFGDYLWFNPITMVRYQMALSPHPPRYPTGTNARFNWVLMRDFEGCLEGQLQFGTPLEVVEYLLPFEMGGFQLDQIVDKSGFANLNGIEWQAVIGDELGDIQPLASPVDLATIRGLIVTLRGRLENEDPDFTIQGYSSSTPFLDFGVDLDGEPTNGLARVRVERTVVDLRNMVL